MLQNTLNHFKVVIFNLPIVIAIFKYTLVSCGTIAPHIHQRQGFAENLGVFCREDVQCRVTFTVQAECRNNACVCSEGSHYAKDQGRCYKSAGIGEMCQTPSNCYIEGSPSYCVDGYCSCPWLHHPTADKKNCLKSLFLGEICARDEECITENSRCYGHCSCGIGYVLSEDKKKCLEAAHSIGDPCQEDTQCQSDFLKNAKCSEDKKCTCVLDFKRRGTVCLRNINPDMMGKKCSTRAQCVKPMPESDLTVEEVANVDCLKGICSCAQDYILTEDRTDCIRYSDNGAEQTMAIYSLPILIISRFIGIV